MSLAGQQVSWSTYSGDVVTVFATATPDTNGGVKVRWSWRRVHPDGARVLAKSAEPKKRRRDALWEARRVNPEVAVCPLDGAR